MSGAKPQDEAIPPAPYAALRERLLAVAGSLDQSGHPAAAELRGVIEAWWSDQRRWDESLSRRLGVHHEINNALVGVRGNTQLLLLSDAAQAAGVRERLEVVIRESGRIRDAAAQLRDLKAALHGSGTDSRAA